jgi:exoribonuclease II
MIIPSIVVEGVRVLLKEIAVSWNQILEICGHCHVRHILNILASAVSRAVIRTRSSLASLAFISRETFALASSAVANSTVGTLRVFVAVS